MKTVLFLLCIIPNVNLAQESLDALLKRYNTKNIPYISVEELKQVENKAIVLDAREQEEYEVSHIKNARFVGYNHFEMNEFSKLNFPKDTLIIVYCSLGIRSEVIAHKLQKEGYTNIQNLYGGIFEWKNSKYDVIDAVGNPTEKIHAYSKSWSKWLANGEKYVPSKTDKFSKN